MKITTDKIDLTSQQKTTTYEATKVDYDSYKYTTDTITTNKTYSATKVEGVDNSAPTDRTICSNSTICSNNTIVKS